jgi:hypothetical protein
MGIRNLSTLNETTTEDPEEEVAPEVPLDPETPVEAPPTAPGPEGPRPATDEPPQPGIDPGTVDPDDSAAAED